MLQVGKVGSTALMASQMRFLLASETAMAFTIELVAVHVDVQKLGAFLLNLVQNRLVFLLELFKLVRHVFLLLTII